MFWCPHHLLFISLCSDKKVAPRSNGLYYSIMACQGDKNQFRSNKATQELLRSYWTLGDASLIATLVRKEGFTWTWLPGTPQEEIITRNTFGAWFNDLMAQGAAKGGPALGSGVFMLFQNVVQRQVGDTSIEFGEWIVEGFQKGTYMNVVKENQVQWAIGRLSLS